MEDEKPLVTVIIPSYNYGRFVGEAIDSVLKQDYPQDKIEVIVVDDGSTDDTRNVAAEYGDKITYIHQENSGLGWAMKTGIDAARGKYILNLDADDLFLPPKIQTVVDIFESDEDIVHVGHPVLYWYVDGDIKKPEHIPDEITGRKIRGKDLLSYFYRRNTFFGGGSTVSGRAEVLKKIPINKGVTMFVDELVVLFLLNSGSAFFVEEPLSTYRVHGGSYCLRDLKDRPLRDLPPIEAIFSEVSNNDFDEEIKVLYGLKVKVSQLRSKEYCCEKSISDITGLWSYVLKNRSVFGRDFFRVIRNYRVLQRSLPTTLVKFVRHKRLVM